MVLWRTASQVSIVSFSQNFINLDAVHEVFQLTGFYGFSERQRRCASWEMFRSLVVEFTVL